MLAERAARAFGKDRDFGAQVVAGLEVGLALAEFVDALVVGAHAHNALTLVKHGHSREARKEAHPGALHPFPQPLGEFVQRDKVVAMIVEEGRCEERLPSPTAREVVNRVPGDRRLDRGALGCEIRDELAQRAGIEDGAGNAMRPDLPGLLQEVDVFRVEGGCEGLALLNLLVVGLEKLGQAEGATESRRPPTDDQDVGFQGFPLRVWHG